MTLDELHGRAVCSIEDAGEVLEIGRSAAYAAAKRGQIPTIKVGRRKLVAVPALLRMLGDGPERDATPGDEPGVAEVMPQATIDQKAT